LHWKPELVLPDAVRDPGMSRWKVVLLLSGGPSPRQADKSSEQSRALRATRRHGTG